MAYERKTLAELAAMSPAELLADHEVDIEPGEFYSLEYGELLIKALRHTLAAQPAKEAASLPLDCIAQALGLDIFDYQLADVLRMVECLQQTNRELAEENLRYKQALGAGAPLADAELAELEALLKHTKEVEQKWERDHKERSLNDSLAADAEAGAELLRAAPGLLARVRRAEARAEGYGALVADLLKSERVEEGQKVWLRGVSELIEGKEAASV